MIEFIDLSYYQSLYSHNMGIAKINIRPCLHQEDISKCQHINCYRGHCEQKRIELLTKKNVLNMFLLTLVSAAHSPCRIGDVGQYHSWWCPSSSGCCSWYPHFDLFMVSSTGGWYFQILDLVTWVFSTQFCWLDTCYLAIKEGPCYPSSVLVVMLSPMSGAEAERYLAEAQKWRLETRSDFHHRWLEPGISFVGQFSQRQWHEWLWLQSQVDLESE